MSYTIFCFNPIGQELTYKTSILGDIATVPIVAIAQ